jgi:hypothetical protein
MHSTRLLRVPRFCVGAKSPCHSSRVISVSAGYFFPEFPSDYRPLGNDQLINNCGEMLSNLKLPGGDNLPGIWKPSAASTIQDKVESRLLQSVKLTASGFARKGFIFLHSSYDTE